MPPLRGAKINSGFLLVRRRFDLLLFRGAQLIATMHTYFCSRPRKIAAATFTHPSTNPPRFFHYACIVLTARRARSTRALAVHSPCAYSFPFSLSCSLSHAPSSSFPFRSPLRFYCGENWPQLRWPGFPEIAITNPATTCCSTSA